MIEKRQVQKLSERWQTTADNIVREYFQHLFLSHMYQEKGSDRLLFKGGTALRIIWHSPRFSEDLDFTGVNLSIKNIEALMEGALAKIEMEGIGAEIIESKSTSGGYLAIFRFKSDEYDSRIQIEVSLRKGKKGEGPTAALIQSDLVMPYTLIHLTEKALVSEKIQACLTRGKARDFYDLYFILRSRMAFKDIFIHNGQLKSKIVRAIMSGKLDFRRELKTFLPVSQHMVIKGFPKTLLTEIERNLAG